MRTIYLFSAEGIRQARFDYKGKRAEVLIWKGRTYVLRSDGGYYQVEPLPVPENLNHDRPNS